MSGGISSNIYVSPKTFMDMLLECAQFIERARHDETSTVTKADVLDSTENRLSLLVGKMASQPASCTFHIELAPVS
jgi:hypothetical protein